MPNKRDHEIAEKAV